MNKKFAWTITELVVAMIFIMTIAGFMISNFKPNQQKAKINAFAAMRNIQKGVISVGDVKEKEQMTQWSGGRKDIFTEVDTFKNANKDTFCMLMADAFTIKSGTTVNCAKNTAIDTANITFPNGLEVYGLASAVVDLGKSTTESKLYSYKNILVDIDGKRGRNRLGVDRFPLRIYAIDNIVVPVNCAETEIYDWRLEGINGSTGIITMTDAQKNPYCKTGKNFNGTRSTQNFLLDTEVITYDAFRNYITTKYEIDDLYGQYVIDKTDNKYKREYEVESSNRKDSHKYIMKTSVKAKDELIAFSKSYAEVICGIYGGKKFLSVKDCSNLKMKIFPECPNLDSCKTCASQTNSICPMNGDTQTNPTTCVSLYKTLGDGSNAYNSNICYFFQHQHVAGLSAIIQGMMGSDLQME